LNKKTGTTVRLAGIGLGGMEKGFPPRLFGAVFEKARKAGFHTTAHAGKADDEESVRGAVNGLLVSVNTDAPAMFGNPFCREIESLVDEFGFTEKEVVRLMENAAENSWMTQDEKDGFKNLLRARNAASEKDIDAL